MRAPNALERAAAELEGKWREMGRDRQAHALAAAVTLVTHLAPADDERSRDTANLLALAVARFNLAEWPTCFHDPG